jgi:threonine dehydratase
MRLIIERCKIVVEPAGAAATAALLAGKVPGARGTRTVTLLSGGNIDLRMLAEFLA